jgi:hypothetical protein
MKGKYEKKGPIKKKPIDEEYAAKYYRKKEARKTSIEQNNKRKCSQAELERSRLYKQQNKEKINETRRKYNALIMEDPIQRLKRNIKCQLLSKIRKTAPSTSYFGTNVNFIKTWLEFNFTDDMTWSNYGSYWQIDHTIAINLWDLASDEEVQTCFNWKNMMPLEKTIENPLDWCPSVFVYKNNACDISLKFKIFPKTSSPSMCKNITKNSKAFYLYSSCNTLKLRETPKAQATNSPVETHGEEPG